MTNLPLSFPLCFLVYIFYVFSIGQVYANELGKEGPLGEWPTFEPIGFITATFPDSPAFQTHLYGDAGGTVGEEFILIQDNKLKLIYHSYHESYMVERTHEKEVLDNWSLGYDPVTQVKHLPFVRTGGPDSGGAWAHTDTPGYIKHPLTGEHLLYYEAKPGTKYRYPEWHNVPGWETSIHVATSQSPPTMNTPFVQDYKHILTAEFPWEKAWNNNGSIKGGLSEPTPVWNPHLGVRGKIRLFYRGLNCQPNERYNWRISYADSEDGKTNWTKNPTPTFDPNDPNNPAYRWTQPNPVGFSYRGAWQAHCTGDSIADGVHMVLMVSPQGFAGRGHFAYYWSPDWGDTWVSHPNNPILAPGDHSNGVPEYGFQRTPSLAVDNEFNRYIIAYNATQNANNEPNKRRTYIALSSRPDPSRIRVTAKTKAPLRIHSLSIQKNGCLQCALNLPMSGILSFTLYSMTGRLLSTHNIGNKRAGHLSISLNMNSHDFYTPATIAIIKIVLQTQPNSLSIVHPIIILQ